MLSLQDLMNFVLSKAGQLLQANVDGNLCLSAAKAIVQECEVAESNSMPMAASTLDGLLQLLQQASQDDVSLFYTCPQKLGNQCIICLFCFDQKVKM